MIFLTIIGQMGCGKIYAFIFKGMSSIKDERLKKLTELIEGVKILKIHSWEKPFIQRIQENRAQ